MPGCRHYQNPEGVIAEYNSELEILIMPKIKYPRPCPTCGKHLNSSHFFQQKKRCGTTEHGVQCLFCPLTFAYKQDMEWHVRQQHSNNPFRFPYTICGTELTSARKLNFLSIFSKIKELFAKLLQKN